MISIKSKVKDLFNTIFKAIAPDPILSISEWSDKYREIPEGMAEAGKWRTARTPYLKDIMDDLSPNSDVNKVVVMKASQLGFTEAILNVMFYYIHYVPSTQMVVYPTVETAQRTSKGRIEKSLRRMPFLKKLIGERQGREGSNTILGKDYPGGQLYLSGSNSPASLASTPIKIILMDEVDRFSRDCGGEGDPTKLAEKRTSTYGSTKKIAYISTPVSEDDSIIVNEFQDTDQKYCYVPCPLCDFYQIMEFENLIYQVKGKDAYNAKLRCKNCSELIDESHKTSMLAQYKWIAHKPENKKGRGYFINGLYCPSGWVSWTEIADEKEKARGDEEKEKVFENTRKGLPHIRHGEAPDIEMVYLKRENYEMGVCPNGTVFLTMGVDVQGNRLEAEVVAFGLNHESWSIDYIIFDGDTNKIDPWDALEKWIRDTYYSVTGSHVKLPIQIAFIDSGYRTQIVYNFVRRFEGNRVYAIKGQDNYTKAVSVPSYVDVVINENQKKLKRGIAIYHIGTSLIKEQFYSNLKINKPKEGERFPAWYTHFPEYDYKYFQSLCSEKCVLATVKGRVRKDWKKIYERNEALDVRVYATAAAYLYGFNTMSEEKLEKAYNDLYNNTKLKTKNLNENKQPLSLIKKPVIIRRREGSYMK